MFTLKIKPMMNPIVSGSVSKNTKYRESSMITIFMDYHVIGCDAIIILSSVQLSTLNSELGFTVNWW